MIAFFPRIKFRLYAKNCFFNVKNGISCDEII
jgi:hypothetical protein